MGKEEEKEGPMNYAKWWDVVRVVQPRFATFLAPIVRIWGAGAAAVNSSHSGVSLSTRGRVPHLRNILVRVDATQTRAFRPLRRTLKSHEIIKYGSTYRKVKSKIEFPVISPFERNFLCICSFPLHRRVYPLVQHSPSTSRDDEQAL